MRPASRVDRADSTMDHTRRRWIIVALLKLGDEVEVYVLGVDRERSRISLSRKYLLPRPWDEVDSGLGETDPMAAPLVDKT